VSFSPTETNHILAQVKKDDRTQLTSAESSIAVAAFKERVEQYAKLRERVEGKLPTLSDKSKPEEIEAHRVSFQKMVKTERAAARQGDIFTPDIARHIREVIRGEFKGARLKELRSDVLTAGTKGVPLRVNSPYPETKESVEMPPTLLLKLPEIPKQVRYRFVGRHLLLVDREARLILDLMNDALP
jgi:hypothetical protein